ncbi:hypothetical protein KC963_00295, partial [Candidatus Saccharibacteria bacterium]|nr:hypothetical protein [Candidatus Saccharibacteria bacterium]
MTVTTTTSRVEYSGDGSTTPFAVPFYFLQDTDLVVYKNETRQTITTHYSVKGAGNPSGGTIKFVSAPASTDTVVIFRDAEITQNVDYINNDPFPAETHETALDRLTMVELRNRDLLDRALVLPDSDTNVPDMSVPDLATRANKTFYWNSLGQPSVADVSAATVTFSPYTQPFSGNGSDTDFILTEAPGSASALIVAISGVLQKPNTDFTVSGTTISFTSPPASGTNNISVQCFGFSRIVDAIDSDAVSYIPPFASSRTRSLQGKLAEVVYVTDFYLSGDVDYTQAVIRASNSVSGPVVVCFPPGGPYVLSSTITFSKDRVVLCGFGPASPINFVPTADDELFVFDKGAGAVYSMVQCVIKDLVLYSSDTTYSKTAFKLVDVSELIWDNVQT